MPGLRHIRLSCVSVYLREVAFPTPGPPAHASVFQHSSFSSHKASPRVEACNPQKTRPRYFRVSPLGNELERRLDLDSLFLSLNLYSIIFPAVALHTISSIPGSLCSVSSPAVLYTRITKHN